MKRKVRTQPTNPFYSDEPAVSRSQIAAKSMVPSGSLSNKPPHGVERNPGRESGLAGFVDKHKLQGRPQKINTSPKFPTQGKLRMSGHSGAHRLGSKLKV